MKPPSSDLPARLREVRDRIASAAARSGREVDRITLVGVVKTVPIELVREALAAGLVDLGENRVQEARSAIEAVAESSARWHLIGHLQRNKAVRAAVLFDRIQSVDSIELAAMLSRAAISAVRTLRVMIQVNVSGETSKHGVEPGALAALVGEVSGLPGLSLDGLMAIGSAGGSVESARREFARTRELRDGAEEATGVRLPELSMGMSGDYEIAIEEGSTMVRIGTALFGSRV